MNDETDSFTWSILQTVSTLVDFARVEHSDVAGLHAFRHAAPVKVHFSAEADDHIVLRMHVRQTIVVFSKILKVVHAHPQIWSQPELTKPLPQLACYKHAGFLTGFRSAPPWCRS